jgi:hypothetical protein
MKIKKLFGALLTAFILNGCVTTTNSPEYRSKLFSLYNSAVEDAIVATKISEPKIYLIGYALWGGEDWSENDVLVFKQAAEMVYPRKPFINFIFSNKEINLPIKYPSFNHWLSDRTIDFVRKRITTDDILVINYSSHANQNYISVRVGTKKWKSLPVGYFARIINRFSDIETIVIADSCHAGALSDKIARTNLTAIFAASAERKSFGCTPLSNNTFFGSAFKQVLEQQKRNDKNIDWEYIFSKVLERIRDMESNEGVIPSEAFYVIGEN